MTTFLWAMVGVIIAGAAIVLWRRTGPGKRLRLGAVNLYYTPTVTPDEAKWTAEHLVRQKFEMDGRLTRDGPTYRLQLICSSDDASERQTIGSEVLAAGLSDEVFGGNPVEVQICDRIFRPMATIRHQRRFGRRIGMNAAHLFYLEGVTDDEALWVATFLAGMGVFNDEPKIAQMNRGSDGYEFRLAVEVDPLTPAMLEGERQMATDLSRVLKGALVSVHFCKGLLGTLRTEQPQDMEQAAAGKRIAGGPHRTEVFHIPGHLSGPPPESFSK